MDTASNTESMLKGESMHQPEHEVMTTNSDFDLSVLNGIRRSLSPMNVLTESRQSTLRSPSPKRRVR